LAGGGKGAPPIVDWRTAERAPERLERGLTGNQDLLIPADAVVGSKLSDYLLIQP